MFEDVSPTVAKVPLDESAAESVQRVARWIRIVGTIQLAFAGMGLLLLIMTVGCGVVAAGPAMGMMALAITLIPLVAIAVFLFQALRIQAAGEQFKNLADDHDVDFLELAFVRLKTVYVIDIVIGALLLLQGLGGAL